MVFEKLEDVEVKTGKLLVNRVAITVRVCVGGWVGGWGRGWGVRRRMFGGNRERNEFAKG